MDSSECLRVDLSDVFVGINPEQTLRVHSKLTSRTSCPSQLPNSRLQERARVKTNRLSLPTLSHLDSTMLALQLLLAALPLAACLKFDIQAHPGHESASKERCIRNFVGRDQLVVVTVTASGSRGDGQTLNMHVRLCNRSTNALGSIH